MGTCFLQTQASFPLDISLSCTHSRLSSTLSPAHCVGSHRLEVKHDLFSPQQNRFHCSTITHRHHTCPDGIPTVEFLIFFFLKTVQTVNFRSAFFRPHQYRAMRTLKIQPIQGYLGLLCGATGKRQEEETPSKLKHDGYHIDDDRPSKWVLFGQSGAGW